MEQPKNRMSNLTKGLIISLIFHIIILTLLRFINIGIYFAEPEFIEVGLLSEVHAQVISPQFEKTIIKVHQVPVTEEQGPEKELVELPIAKESGEEEFIQKPPMKELPPVFLPGKEEEKEIPSPMFAQGESYIIEGELSKRRVVYKVVPPYPEGYNIETDVKVEIWVSPDGEIERLILIKKGGDIFGHITLDALKEWKFERLPTHLPQETQKGIVTFMYRLR